MRLALICVVSLLATHCAGYMDRVERERLRTRVSNMFDWSYDAYVRHAYPMDELLVRCTQTDLALYFIFLF
jgi:hypothetical protein